MSKLPPQGFVQASVPNTLALTCLAREAFTLSDENDLPLLQAAWARHGRLRIVGLASNLVLPPELDDPVVLVRLRGVRLAGQSLTHRWVDVAAGEVWHDWVMESIRRGWPGLENLALIPGTVGACPVQNIGAYGVEVADRLEHVRVWDFEQRRVRCLTREACRFGYRDSVFKTPAGQSLLILSVRFALPLVWQPVLDYPDLAALKAQASAQPGCLTPEAIAQQVMQVRRAKLPDPATEPNVGSFFKNPVISTEQAEALKRRFPSLVAYPVSAHETKLAAGWLIDQCGWKGRGVGEVQVHDRQALVLVNRGGASATDVLAVATQIATDVVRVFGVTLEIEPVCWT